MRIAFSGTANSGKSTLVKSFLYTWTNYETPKKTYRDVLEEKGLEHSSKTTTETQTAVLDFLIDSIQGKTLKDKIVYDRCPLDAVAYTMWANGKGIEGFTDEFVEKQIAMSKEALRSLDIIFMTRFNEDIMKVEDDGTRDANLEYIKEMDNIFYSLYMQYMVHADADVEKAAKDKADREAAEQRKAELKASAKAKLIAGDPLTAEEADTIVF